MADVMYIISKVEKIQSPMKIVEMAHAQLCTSVQLNWHSERANYAALFVALFQSDQVVGKSGTMKRIRTCAKTSNHE
jgi:hypothetical protein